MSESRAVELALEELEAGTIGSFVVFEHAHFQG